MADFFTETPIKGLKSHNSSTPTASTETSVLPALANATAPAFTEGRIAFVSVDLSGRLRHSIEGIAGATPSATNALPTRLTDGTAFISSGNPLPVTLGAGSVSENIAQIVGAAPSATNALPVRITDGTTYLGTAANPVYVFQTDTAPGTLTDSGVIATGSDIAAGATTTLNSTAVTTGSVSYLREFDFASSVRCRVDLQTFNGTTATTVRTFLVDAYKPLNFLPDPVAISQTPGAGVTWRALIKNMDNINAAGAYVSFVYHS